jgi:hypothetical protein
MFLYAVLWRYADPSSAHRQVEKLSEKAQEYESLLKELGNVVESRAADRIRSLLDKVGFLLPALHWFISLTLSATAWYGGGVVLSSLPVTISDTSG